MPEDHVHDDERLYRAVSNLPQNFPVDSDGNRRLSSQVFSDRMMRPSVDRAHLRGFDPSKTQFDPTDGILGVTAYQVRGIRVSRNDAGGNPIQEYVADVEPVPTEENPAHAEISGRPGFDNKNVFRRVCESLARTATWELPPADLRSNVA